MGTILGLLESFLPSVVMSILKSIFTKNPTQEPLEVTQTRQAVTATIAAAEETKVAEVAQQVAAVEVQAPKTKQTTVKKLSDGQF